MKYRTRLVLCWRCGYRRSEWLTLRIFLARRGRCFNCRIDAIDRRYGPSASAKRWKRVTGGYGQPSPTRWASLIPRLGLWSE